ncbi:MAG: hypothetical protein J2P38_06400, partial [Candidatus Dormibacteraeota bacterium]|nr:hypothetical protein [Candidatus Dormibacteraeota bacterium]
SAVPTVRLSRSARGVLLEASDAHQDLLLAGLRSLTRFPEIGRRIHGRRRRLLILPFAVIYDLSPDRDEVTVISIRPAWERRE